MGKVKKGFNAKARAGKRTNLLSTKEIVENNSKNSRLNVVEKNDIIDFKKGNDFDTNAELIIPKEASLRVNAEIQVDIEKPLSSKKLKKREKFIEKQLKKQNRIEILNNLAKNSFKEHSKLLQSSKHMGKKLTLKEQLAKSLLAERMGFKKDEDDRLYVKRTDSETVGFSQFENSKSLKSLEYQEDINLHLSNTNSAPIILEKIENKSLISLAFECSPSINNNNSTLEKKVLVVDDSGSDISKSTVQPVPVFGSALKRTADNNVDVVKSKRKKKVKKAAVIKSIPRKEVNTSDSDNYSDIVNTDAEDLDQEGKVKISSTIVAESATLVHWESDVILGEGESFLQYKKNCNKSSLELGSSQMNASAHNKNSLQSSRAAFFVPVDRPHHIQISRVNLPVVAEEQPIMEAIFENDVVILCGETGSGKTTQVPQFLYEAGFGDSSHPLFSGMVGVTQPRRVAAVSMAKRVSEEMALKNGEIGHQVRYDSSTVGPLTRVKFMTDGILLRELSSASKKPNSSRTGAESILLTQYSCIIIDEAHERTVGTDVLIGWLSRIASVRNSKKIAGVKPLKLIIMSATLRVEDFISNSTLFPSPQKPPVIKVDGRQYKVVVHFNKRTPQVDYLAEVFKKVSKIHEKLPPGGILVFLTGQREVQVLCKKLDQKYNKAFTNLEIENKNLKTKELNENINALENDNFFGEIVENDDMDKETDDFDFQKQDDFELEDASDSEEEEVHILDGASDDEKEEKQQNMQELDKIGPLHILPLYSLLPTKEQLKVFEEPPIGMRLCVIATNVAETSLTIPGIKYVVDCGKVKERQHDIHTGVQTYKIGWTSKASADQRAGRAGRVGAGHCYRIFSSAVFSEYFEQFQKPEILRVPIDGVILQMKSMGINQIVNFPFPTPPEKFLLKEAEKVLGLLGAIDSSSDQMKITPLGTLMSKFPTNPRFAKMLILAAQQKGNNSIIPYIIAIVAGLSVGDPFIRDESFDNDAEDEEMIEEDKIKLKEDRKIKRGNYFKVMQMFSGENPVSDVFRLLNAIGAYNAENLKGAEAGEKFCESHFLRLKAMEEITKLRFQLTNLLKSNLTDGSLYPSVNKLEVDLKFNPPTKSSLNLILQIIFSGFPDHVAKLDFDVGNRIPAFGGKNAFPVYQSMQSGPLDVLQIHPSSCLFRERPAPLYVIYEELIGREERISADNKSLLFSREKFDLLGKKIESTSESQAKPKKLWMKGVTSINLNKLFWLAPKSLVHQGKILEQPEPKFIAEEDACKGFVVPHFGSKLWTLDLTEAKINDLNVQSQVFCRYLLEGKLIVESLFNFAVKNNVKGKKQPVKEEDVFSFLKQYLLSKPVILTKSYSQSQTRVKEILFTLRKNEIFDIKSFLTAFKQEVLKIRNTLLRSGGNANTSNNERKLNFFLNEYLLWVPEVLHPSVKKGWPYFKFVDNTNLDVLTFKIDQNSLSVLKAEVEKIKNETDIL
ncbi:putative ATP-dependent RNA helicase DHR1 [Clydaea vesicula]|uniref:RNA helicase n=1 Tax=Clydaea vesicula TaxID=447962 RepID=A0AAD5U3U2_9FUNG|nr:putative ATP-dependent RNA helicase DHR1 [Clydaea vesicula]